MQRKFKEWMQHYVKSSVIKTESIKTLEHCLMDNLSSKQTHSLREKLLSNISKINWVYSDSLFL